MKNATVLLTFMGIAMIVLFCGQGSEDRIALIPIGAIDGGVLRHLEDSLQGVFGATVETRPGFDELKFAYNLDRDQYHSTQILRRLSSLDGMEKYQKVLGIVDVDLYVPELNFVFGEALGLRGKFAVISLIRLRQEFYGLKPDSILFVQRALKEAVHELGHLYGLGHCPDPKCVMHFSNSLRDTDRKGTDFCPECRRRIE